MHDEQGFYLIHQVADLFIGELDIVACHIEKRNANYTIVFMTVNEPSLQIPKEIFVSTLGQIPVTARHSGEIRPLVSTNRFGMDSFNKKESLYSDLSSTIKKQ